MPNWTEYQDAVSQAIELAREIAPDIDVLLITHYPDVETLDTFRPGDTDLQTVLAVNKAVAVGMLDAGVKVLVQRADRAGFRRWMADRDDTAENRHAWIDRGPLLRRLGGVGGSWRQGFGGAPGSGLRQGARTDRGPAAGNAFGDDDGGEFDDPGSGS